MFRSQLFDHLLGGRLSCLVLLLPSLPDIRHAHTHRQHYSHIPNKRHKQAEKVVTALSTKRRPPEDGQTIVTETCRFLIDVFYKYF